MAELLALPFLHPTHTFIFLIAQHNSINRIQWGCNVHMWVVILNFGMNTLPALPPLLKGRDSKLFSSCLLLEQHDSLELMTQTSRRMVFASLFPWALWILMLNKVCSNVMGWPQIVPSAWMWCIILDCNTKAFYTSFPVRSFIFKISVEVWKTGMFFAWALFDDTWEIAVPKL